MTRIAILGKNPQDLKTFKKNLGKLGYTYSEEDPELVVCYGGDGMFLIAERVFPKIPKMLLRNSQRGNKASNLTFTQALKRYAQQKYVIEKIGKLKATSQGRFESRRIIGINDIVIRNRLPTEAVRFKYKINNGPWSKELLGDGIVAATPFGSGAYYHSITGHEITKGLAIAFNNLTSRRKPLHLPATTKVIIKITRGEAVLVGDNNRDFISLETGDKITIHYTKSYAKRIIFP